jgi:OOP family OmpA-OmpF porin
MVIVVAGWYVWGDAISGKPAGPDHGREQRAARDTNVVPDRAQSGRAAPGSPQNGTPAEKAENAAPNLEFTLTFAPDSVQLSSDARNVLALVVDLLRDFPLAVAVIEGHTDPGADPASNRAIAESRAAAATRHLVRNGVAPARLSSVAMGSETPVESSGAFPEGGQNHRVVIRVAAAKPG